MDGLPEPRLLQIHPKIHIKVQSSQKSKHLKINSKASESFMILFLVPRSYNLLFYKGAQMCHL